MNIVGPLGDVSAVLLQDWILNQAVYSPFIAAMRQTGVNDSQDAGY